MSHLKLICSLLAALVCRTCLAQGSLPDSIPLLFGTDCELQRDTDPRVCCISGEGTFRFCPLQCVLAAPNSCLCIDSFTMNVINGLEGFPEPDPSEEGAINCVDVFPPPSTTEEATTTEQLATTEAPPQESTTEAPQPTPAPTETTQPEEEPTEDEEDSDTSRRNSGSRCPRVDQLTCLPACVVEDKYGCPSCDDNCQNLDANDDCRCTDTQVCLRVGRFGAPQCINRTGVGERCDGGSNEEQESEEDTRSNSASDSTGTKRRKSRVRGTIRGARERLAYGRLEQAEVECQDNLVCVEVGEDRKECQPENENGPCVIARATSPLLTCTPEGDFEPLQCLTAGFPTMCHCVEPSDGTPVPGTQVVVADPGNFPDCDNEVFESCTRTVGGTRFGVAHGDYLVDVASCRRCLCDDGSLTECEPAQTCQSIQLNPTSCQYDGNTISHGERFDIGCNECGCYNGNIRCTRRGCDRAPIRDQCASCDSDASSQVCGFNGVTYRSRCRAVYCSGQIPFTLTPGPCNAKDVCSMFPCDEGETCIKKGGATCMGYCEADDFRMCVNLNELVCEETLVMSEEGSQTLCATNGVTYPSLCHLIQDTGNEGVAYAGACGSEKCSGGSVCGTDGITYENVCILRSTSGNARLDYSGPCISDAAATCDMVRAGSRCAHNFTNCKFLIESGEGCCPLCGGLVIVALELRGLREYVRINPEVRNLDALYTFLVESEIIPSQLTERCEIGFTFTSRNLEIALQARTADDEEFCSDASSKMADLIDNPQQLTTYTPDSFQFATAAVGGPPVIAGAVQVTVQGYVVISAVIAATLSFIYA